MPSYIIATDTLITKNINDFYTSERKGFGFSISTGINPDKSEANKAPEGSTTVSIKDKREEREQNTRATIGNGSIVIAGKEVNEENNNLDLIRDLNRNKDKSQEITKDMITGALDASMTIDNRLLFGFINQNVYERDEDGKVKKDADGKSIVMKQRDKDGNLMLDKNGNTINQTTNGYKSVGRDIKNFIPNTGLAVVGAVDTTKFVLDVASDIIGMIPGSPVWVSRQKDVPPHPFPSLGIGDEVMGESSLRRDENNKPVTDDGFLNRYVQLTDDLLVSDRNPLFRFLYAFLPGAKSMTDNHDIEMNKILKEGQKNNPEYKIPSSTLKKTILPSFLKTLYSIPGTAIDFKNYGTNYKKIKDSYNNGVPKNMTIIKDPSGKTIYNDSWRLKNDKK